MQLQCNSVVIMTEFPVDLCFMFTVLGTEVVLQGIEMTGNLFLS